MFLFLEQYVLLGNYLRDQDRFETFDALLLDFLRESILAGSQGGELSEAWQEHQKLVDATMASQGEIARLEDEHLTLTRRLERAGSLMGRIGLGSDPATCARRLATLKNVCIMQGNESNTQRRASKLPAETPTTLRNNIRSAWAIT